MVSSMPLSSVQPIRCSENSPALTSLPPFVWWWNSKRCVLGLPCMLIVLYLSPETFGVYLPQGCLQPLQAGAFQLQLLLFFPRNCMYSLLNSSHRKVKNTTQGQAGTVILKFLTGMMAILSVEWTSSESKVSSDFVLPWCLCMFYGSLCPTIKSHLLRPLLLQNSNCDLIRWISWQSFNQPSGWLFSSPRVHQLGLLESLPLFLWNWVVGW